MEAIKLFVVWLRMSATFCGLPIAVPTSVRGGRSGWGTAAAPQQPAWEAAPMARGAPVGGATRKRAAVPA